MKIVTSTPESDADLAARFACAAEPHFDVLTRGARRLTRCEADAEDLLQDALMHAYAGFSTFADGTNFKAWMFRILYNRWVSGHRAKQRRLSEVALDEVTDWESNGGARHVSEAPRSAEAEFLDALPDNELKAALATLPDGARTAIYYADVLEYTYSETAVVMDIPIGTVMSRVARGRKRLRFALAHLAGGRGDVEADIA
ncbi:RNA polymerase subunit sigma-70 [Mycolicibacterium moriokaense]|uniref:RNA polymerase sigma factor n=1 Tax=Mycolicibacterium moriokaense TaxID=39691 RepID=A0AAD1H8U2_9MYCO|nr:sigma-70 family RNA polymerase sigma factor [Mycolicibacterium moriokaense]MCV7037624.1 sigma-70 family RNA polymerase sigma factor [Mycolicibacterium moriokaense]ORB23675.1 RNA polymerase subunit sigma-70 [Mycolicibacterium moriokaense]BBW99437.1 RNA polymerase sigma factor [Mycolicibacterium moriokaense]